VRVSLALLLGIAMTVASCAGAAETIPPDVDLAVTMKDYRVEMNVTTLKAGTVKIGIKNAGGMEHSFELIKTELAFDKLPMDTGAAKAKEDGLVKQVKTIAVGKVATLTADLAAGKYVVICNVAGHYQLGMRVALTVE
jgi:uncharacterized cupredoxin-like copper-binding protein